MLAHLAWSVANSSFRGEGVAVVSSQTVPLITYTVALGVIEFCRDATSGIHY